MKNPTAICEQRFRLQPDNYAAIADAMTMLHDFHREDLLAVWVERALALDPVRWETLYHQARLHEYNGALHDALTTWQQLAALQPQIDPCGLGIARTLLAQMQIEAARAIAETALARIRGDETLTAQFFSRHTYAHAFHLLLAEIYLYGGDVRGFAYFLAQIQVRCPSYRFAEIPTWSNQQLIGKHLLITAAAGYGDQFLFGALIPKLQKFGCRITFVVHPDLVAIYSETLTGVRIIGEAMPTALRQTPPPSLRAMIAEDQPDLQATLLHLPLMHAALQSQPRMQFPAYLKVPNASRLAAEHDIATIRDAAKGRRLVGITWDRIQRHHPAIVGATEAARTDRSSLPDEYLRNIVDDPRVSEQIHFVALHERGNQRTWPDPMPQNLSVSAIDGGDFGYTAAIIDACEFVVSVDMSVANLSAMLGKQTWMMLAHNADWRWGMQGESPWIKQARAFRQPSLGAWSEVASAVIDALLALPQLTLRTKMETVTAIVDAPIKSAEQIQVRDATPNQIEAHNSI